MVATKLPLFDVPKHKGNVAGGALAVAMVAAKRDILDLRDLPNPPANVVGAGRKPS